MTTPAPAPQQKPGLPTCPDCGREIVYNLTCHTYGQGDKWYACLPCDSAIEYVCTGQLDDEPSECEWHYTHGLNPKNPRAARNEESRPSWLPAGQAAEGGNWVMPGVKAIWE